MGYCTVVAKIFPDGIAVADGGCANDSRAQTGSAHCPIVWVRLAVPQKNRRLNWPGRLRPKDTIKKYEEN